METSLQPDEIAESSRFLRPGALHSLVARARKTASIARLTAAVEDQSQFVVGDIFWAMRKALINLGALSIATHLKRIGLAEVHAYYPAMRGKKIVRAYDLIGLSCNETTVAACLDRIPELRRKLGPDPLIVVGGPGIDNWWKWHLGAGADGVVMGDGQYPLTDLLLAIMDSADDGPAALRGAFEKTRETGRLASVRDFAYIESSGQMRRNDAQGLVRNLDEYLPVDYSLIVGYAREYTKCVQHSAGCVYRCDFCSSIINQRYCYRMVSVNRLLDDLEQAQREGYTELFLASDLFLPGGEDYNRQFLREIVEGRKQRGLGIRMSSQTTVSSLHNLLFKNVGTKNEPRWEYDEGGMRLMKDARIRRWALGVEALSEEERARLGKDPRQSGSDATRTLAALFQLGISVHAMMMVHEETTYERALEIGRTLSDVGVGSVQFFHPVPVPTTPWGASLFERGGVVLESVGGEDVGMCRFTGEYVVAAEKPEQAVFAIEACYDSFTSLDGILRDLKSRRRIDNAVLKMGMRLLVAARRYLSPQYYEYLSAILEGDYSYHRPGAAVCPGVSLGRAGRPRLSFKLARLLREYRKQARLASAP